MKLMMRTVAIACAFAAACCSAEPMAKPKVDLVLSAAVSGNGLAVAAGHREIIVNDGGVERRYILEDSVARLEPGERGVWAATTNAVYYVSRSGLKRYDTGGMPTAIMPADSGAYLVVRRKLIFVGDGRPTAAERQRFDPSTRAPLEVDAETDEGGIHFYER